MVNGVIQPFKIAVIQEMTAKEKQLVLIIVKQDGEEIDDLYDGL
jgi:hypothetical protein